MHLTSQPQALRSQALESLAHLAPRLRVRVRDRLCDVCITDRLYFFQVTDLYLTFIPTFFGSEAVSPLPVASRSLRQSPAAAARVLSLPSSLTRFSRESESRELTVPFEHSFPFLSSRACDCREGQPRESETKQRKRGMREGEGQRGMRG